MSNPDDLGICTTTSKKTTDIGGTTIQDAGLVPTATARAANRAEGNGNQSTLLPPRVMRAAMEPGVHNMSDELILQISCNTLLAFKWILLMTSGQNISHYTTAKLSVHVWNHDLIWWQNKTDTQKHFRKTSITSPWTLSKTKIPITIVKAQMPSNPNQKSRMRDNKYSLSMRGIKFESFAKLIFEWEITIYLWAYWQYMYFIQVAKTPNYRRIQ